VFAGLFFGKQIGVVLFAWLGVLTGVARLPRELSWLHIYGVGLLCGVGFTMSMFISSLAFQNTGLNELFDERLGIIIGSLLSGAAGYFVLRAALPAADPKAAAGD
jgi:NhaA family Na+:H+ antiporter